MKMDIERKDKIKSAWAYRERNQRYHSRGKKRRTTLILCTKEDMRMEKS